MGFSCERSAELQEVRLDKAKVKAASGVKVVPVAQARAKASLPNAAPATSSVWS